MYITRLLRAVRQAGKSGIRMIDLPPAGLSLCAESPHSSDLIHLSFKTNLLLHESSGWAEPGLRARAVPQQGM